MKEFVFEAESRKITGKQVRALRREGRLPAVLYGHHVEPLAITLDFHTASQIMSHVSTSHLVKVALKDGETFTALVGEKQRHPVTDALIHVDFRVVSLTELLKAMVAIELLGDAPAVKNYSGVLVEGQNEIEVECLPSDLPERIRVDISNLDEIGDAIHVRDPRISSNLDGSERVDHPCDSANYRSC
jgi:large subunit ribosomal protein L25